MQRSETAGSANAHPYDALTPDVILNAVETAGTRCTGALLALNSYENRVYRVRLEEETRVRLGRCLGRLYLVGARARFSHRPTLTIKDRGQDAVTFVLSHNLLPD